MAARPRYDASRYLCRVLLVEPGDRRDGFAWGGEAHTNLVHPL